MRWSSKLVPSRIKKLVAAITVASAGLFTTNPTLPAQDVLPPSVLECENCFDGGLGGWNLYWHDPGACSSSCHCRMGDWTCPTAAAPWIFASVEFMPLIRDQMSPVIFAARASQTKSITSTTTGAITTKTTTTTTTRTAELTEDDFTNEFDPGMRISLGVALNDQLRLEGSFVGNYSWSGTTEARLMSDPSGLGNLLAPFSHFGDAYANPGLPTLTQTLVEITGEPPIESGDPYAPVAGVDYNSRITVSYTSEFSMSELNLRRRLSNISTPRVAAEASVLVGLRQVSISEHLHYEAESDTENRTNDVQIGVNNRLFGMQIGFQTQFLVSQRTWIDFDAKGAILFGRANLATSADFPDLPAPNSSDGTDYASEQVTAFLGDLALRYNYQLTPSLTLNAGYNAFFLDGVALASKNLSHNTGTLIDGTPQPDHTGRIVYHGPSLGLVFAR